MSKKFFLDAETAKVSAQVLLGVHQYTKSLKDSFVHVYYDHDDLKYPYKIKLRPSILLDHIKPTKSRSSQNSIVYDYVIARGSDWRDCVYNLSKALHKRDK